MILQEFVGLQRRYTRSINLERDYFSPAALTGYVPTARGLEVLARLVDAAVTPNSMRAWTVSGVYGTGKSALGLFLGGIFAGRSAFHHSALELLNAQGPLYRAALTAVNQLPGKGFLLAFAVGQREPLAHVVTRAVARGAESFWKAEHQPESARQAVALYQAIQNGETVGAKAALAILRAVAKDAQSGVLLIIDELGKVLEHAVTNRTADDLYLLQQIAELPNGKSDVPILSLLLLHQSFAAYAMPLQAAERAEWGKVQGRFEDVPYAEGPGAMVRLLGQAVTRKDMPGTRSAIASYAKAWSEVLLDGVALPVALDESAIAALYPLHPYTAVALPIICSKYAQNDRSLFSFMASSEQHGFQWFLRGTNWRSDAPPTLKAHHLYDYFVETARLAAASRPEFQRWTEIQARVEDSAAASDGLVEVVKTVGLFNLIAMTGALRASRTLVIRALADGPQEFARWESFLDEAVQRNLVTWRRQADELRVWEGSDFDVEQALATLRPTITDSLPALLDRLAPMQPVVARRHSYESGTLRFFERRYIDAPDVLKDILPLIPSGDGILVHWLGGDLENCAIPQNAPDGRPIVVLETAGIERLATAAREVVALEILESSDSRLQTDGIARREVRQRLAIARGMLADELQRACGLEGGGTALTQSGRIRVASWRDLNRWLSTCCDEVYHSGPRLWSELLNRRELTTQGAKARRELISAMLIDGDRPDLGLSGYGPEVSMAKSVLDESGLHQELGPGLWGFGRPTGSFLATYEAIEGYVADATAAPRSVQELFDTLQRPPFGLKAGPLPVLFAAYMVEHRDDVGLYQDGTFVPVVGSEHFELLMKHPHRFSIKSFHVAGEREALRDAVADAFNVPRAEGRKVSLVAIVKRLISHSRRWPEYTRRSDLEGRPTAAALRDALLDAREPDVLLFEAIPEALGVAPVKDDSEEVASWLSARIAEVVAELDQVYPSLLRHAAGVLADAFELPRPINELRMALSRRGRPVLARLESLQLSPRHEDALLRRFLKAATDSSNGDQAWAESTLMIALDRPVEAWVDADVRDLFTRLSQIARRFRNVEAFMAEQAERPEDGFEGRRITLSQPDGTELARMVWIDRSQRDTVDRLVDEVLRNGAIQSAPALKEAFVAALVERVFDTVPQDFVKERPHG